MPKLTQVVLFANGMTMVFDEHRQQYPDYQGHVVRDKERIDGILRDADDGTVFLLAQNLRSGGLYITRAEFESNVRLAQGQAENVRISDQ